MRQRMTKERWDALSEAIHRGIDELSFELGDLDPEDRATYGALEHRLQLANEAYRILLNRRLDKR